MSIERQKGKVIFICDACEDDYDTDEKDFFEALRRVKEEGWLIKRNEDDTEWVHICRHCTTGGTR